VGDISYGQTTHSRPRRIIHQSHIISQPIHLPPPTQAIGARAKLKSTPLDVNTVMDIARVESQGVATQRRYIRYSLPTEGTVAGRSRSSQYSLKRHEEAFHDDSKCSYTIPSIFRNQSQLTDAEMTAKKGRPGADLWAAKLTDETKSHCSMDPPP